MANAPRHHPHESELEEMTSNQFLERIIALWEGLAQELTGIIGDGGFRTLFARSVSLANAKSPKMRNLRIPLQDESPFLYLKASFAERNIEEMRDANASIVSAFIETLSSLVGNTLTTNLLRPAWNERRSPSADEAGSQAHCDPRSVAK